MAAGFGRPATPRQPDDWFASCRQLRPEVVRDRAICPQIGSSLIEGGTLRTQPARQTTDRYLVVNRGVLSHPFPGILLAPAVHDSLRKRALKKRLQPVAAFQDHPLRPCQQAGQT